MTHQESTIAPSDRPLVLAVDVDRSWGAAFRLEFSASGDGFMDIVSAHRTDAGTWEGAASGGSHGSSWSPIPWSPPLTGWDGDALLVGNVFGHTTFDSEDNECELVEVAGFVRPDVRRIRASYVGRERTVPVSATGAFVVAAAGDGSVVLTLEDEDGRNVGEPRPFALDA